jgi:hypothetical protein
MVKTATKRRNRRRQPLPPANDFRQILDLPERLAGVLRLLLHVEKPAWDYLLDKIRQEKKLEEEWKKDSAHADRRYRCSVVYKEWSKSKGPGKGRRHFAAPCAELKEVQRAILYRFLAQIPVHFLRHGERGSGIVSNAAHHLGHKHAFSVDLVNAFPSVFRSRLQANLGGALPRFLSQFRGMELTEGDRKMILETMLDLVCLHDRLPQGPPTSPRLLDIVCYEMDKSLYEIAATHDSPMVSCRVSAYVDDIVFSSSEPIPEDVREQILVTIKKNGFVTHTRRDKMHYYSPETGTVPVVTGLLLTPDGRFKIHPKKVNELRSAFHHMSRASEWDEETRQKAAGYVAFVRQIHPQAVPSKLRKPLAVIEARIAAERNQAPVIIPPILTPRELAVEADAPVASGSTKSKGKGSTHQPSDAALTEVA